MRRFTGVLLCFVLLLSSCSSEAAMTWDEQYEVGVKYLEEGRYEDAAVAFLAAIQIDPKRPEAYLELANAYLALGRDTDAEAILRQGIEATGDESLQAALEERFGGGSGDSSSSGSGDASSSADDELSGYQGAVPFDSLSQEVQNFIVTLAETAPSGDDERMKSTMNLEPEELKTEGSWVIRTVWNGYRIRLDLFSQTETVTGPENTYDVNTTLFEFHMRPRNGPGYAYGVLREDHKDQEMVDFMGYIPMELWKGSCDCSNWQWDGDVSNYHWANDWYADDSGNHYLEQEETLTGRMSAGYWEGEVNYTFVETEAGAVTREESKSCVMEHGTPVSGDESVAQETMMIFSGDII